MYVKLFSSLLNSSIWSEDAETCKVWITLLAMMDADGYIYGSTSGVSRIAALPLKAVKRAMDKFSKPDTESGDLTRNSGAGERIKAIPGGWLVLNAKYYRSLQDADVRREKERIKKHNQRANKGQSPIVPVCPQKSPNVCQSESESYKISTRKNISTRRGASRPPMPSFEEWKLEASKAGLPPEEAESAFHHYEANGWKQSSGRPIVRWQSAVVTCRSLWQKRVASQPKTSKPKTEFDRIKDAEAAKFDREFAKEMEKEKDAGY